MAKSLIAWVAAFLALSLLVKIPAKVRAADGPENEALKKHGLKIAGSLMVLEAEADLKNKLTEARRLSRKLNYTLMKQQGTVSAEEYQQTIQNLTQQTRQLRSQINLATQQINLATQQMNLAAQQTNMFTRFRGMPSGTMAQAQYAELVMYRNQLQMELSQETDWLNQLKSQPFDPKSKDKVGAEVKDDREAYHQAILDLRKLVDSATEKYADLAKNEEVKKIGSALGKGKKEKPKLGPSHEFLSNVKLVEKLEKAESAGNTEESHAKPARRSKTGTRTKRSLKAARGDSASPNE